MNDSRYIINQYTRTATAVDGATVSGPRILLVNRRLLTAIFRVTITGSPASVDVRAAIDTRSYFDDNNGTSGTVDHQVMRFTDITSTSGGVRIGRLRTTAGTQVEAAMTADDLSVASAGAVSEGPLLDMVHLVSFVQTLTGGSSPTVTISIVIVDS